MRRWTAVVGVVIWALVVLVAAGVTWAVIDGAGRNLGTADDGGKELLRLPTSTRAPDPAKGGTRSGPTQSSQTAGTGTSMLTEPTATKTSGPISTPGTDGIPSGGNRYWQGPAGLVAVRCEGARAFFSSATPSNGYRVEVEHSGSQELEVKFESETREFQVDATCLDGQPHYQAEVHNG
jgi:hypothetical protein